MDFIASNVHYVVGALTALGSLYSAVSRVEKKVVAHLSETLASKADVERIDAKMELIIALLVPQKALKKRKE